MKFINWKILFITCAICLLPIVLGLILWERLPETVAIHFNIQSQADGFAPKWFAVLVIPIVLMFFQCFCCVVNDINAHKHGKCKKFETAVKWIIPIMSVVLQSAILCYAIGMNLDMRRIAMIIVGLVLIIIGNYMPKLDYIKNYNIDKEMARKINRFIGFENVIMGVLGIVTVFLSPIFSVIWLVLMIVGIIISVVYWMKIGRR